MASSWSPWQQQIAPARCDVLIVGGGIMGVATAHALRQIMPHLHVVLVDAGPLAAGASGRNAGFLIPGPPADFATAVDLYGAARAKRVLDFTLENIELVQSLDNPLIDLRPTGCVLAAGDQYESEQLRRAAGHLIDAGLDCNYVDSAGVARLTQARDFAGGLHIRAGGMLNPVALVRHLAATSGATVIEHWPVDSIESGSDGVTAVGRHGGITAERAVLALNAYLPRLIPDTERHVRPVRAQMLATEPLDPIIELPIYSHGGFFYVRQTSEGRLLAGGARHLFEEEEVGFETTTTPHLQRALEEYVRSHFPSVGDVRIERRWAGVMGFSEDGLPVAGEIPGRPGMFFAAGFTGHGMAYGMRFGQLMARLAVDERDSAADLFTVER